MIDKIRPLHTQFDYTKRMTVTATQKHCSNNAIPARSDHPSKKSLLCRKKSTKGNPADLLSPEISV
jgi:hypothetical protein